MGTITAKAIIDRAALQLKDTSAKRWTRPEMLSWVNDAQRAIVQAKPTANNAFVVIPLVPGTKQALPAGGWLLIDATRNMAADGVSPGQVVRPVAREFLDRFDPLWHAKTPTDVVDNYVYAADNQTLFFVYPPNSGAGKLEINYSVIPADLATEASPIALLDIYQPHILAYCLAQACLKDADYSAAMKEMAAAYTVLFGQLMGSTTAAESSTNAALRQGVA